MKKEGKIKENNHCLKGLRAYHTNACKKLDGTTVCTVYATQIAALICM